MPPPTELGESPGGPALAAFSPPGAWEDGGSGKEKKYHPCSHATAAMRRAVNYNFLTVNKCCVV